jgi:cytoskeletal protein CcmA (bactofilin family)
MFSSKNSAPPQPSQASAPLNTAKRSGRSSSAPSIISADLVVNGTLTSAGDIQIDGRVDGDVRTGGLVIGDKAVINGQIFAEEVTVRGRVEGSIRARKVLLCATSHVEGDILHEAFAVETGAFFEGNCRHSDNPLDENASMTRKSAPQQQSVAPVQAPMTSTPSSVSSMVTRPVTNAANTTTYAPLKNGI